MMYINMQNVLHHAPKTIAPEDAAKLNPSAKIFELEWHVGMPMPFPLNAHNIHLVVTVTADGDELFSILSRINGIPKHESRSMQTWRGEFAQFIVDNIVAK